MNKRLNLFGELLLLGATLAWGTSFLILKNTINELPAIYVIAVRFLLSSILLGLIFFKRLKSMTKRNFLHGVILGGILYAAYFSQTMGLKYSTPSRNAFVTSVYCVLTPFLVWLIYKKKPQTYNIISAVLCFVGIGFIAFSGKQETGTNVLLGDSITLICSVFYALQIVFIDKFRETDDMGILLVIELFTASVLLFISSSTFEIKEYGIEKFAIKGDVIFNVLYLTVVCTLFAQLAQMFGQKWTSATQTALIFTLEAVFATLFSVIVGKERLSTGLIIGFSIVFVAMFFNELFGSRKTVPKTE